MIESLTGHKRTQKQISSHVQVLRGIHNGKMYAGLKSWLQEESLPKLAVNSNELWCESTYNWKPSAYCQHSNPRNPCAQPGSSYQPDVVTEMTTFLGALLRDPEIHLQSGRKLTIQVQVPKSSLVVASVNRRMRVEILQHLGKGIPFEFYDDISALRCFCSLLSTDFQMHLRYVHIDFIEGRDTYSSIQSSRLSHSLSSLLPNLRSLHITLDPRVPEERSQSDAVEWGPQTKVFIATLHGIRAGVYLYVRFKYDREYFEREYVGKGWRPLVDERDYPL